MISIEPREPHIIFVACGGVAIVEDQNIHQGQPQVRPTAHNKAPLDVQKDKGGFLEMRLQFVDANQPSTSTQVKAIPEQFEQLIRNPQIKKVNKIK